MVITGVSRFEQGAEIGVVFCRSIDFARAAKSRDAGIFPGQGRGAAEKFEVFGVGARPAAFHIVHTESVQPLRDFDFIVGRKGDSFALPAVAQGGVIDDKTIWHALLLYMLVNCCEAPEAFPRRYRPDIEKAAASASAAFWHDGRHRLRC